MRYTRIWGLSLQKLFPVIQLRWVCETWHMLLPIYGLSACISLQHEKSASHLFGWFFLYWCLFPTKILWPIAENLKVTHTSATRKMLSTPSPSPSKACALCAAWGCHGKSAVLSTQLPMWNIHCSLTPGSLLCWALKDFWRGSCTCFKGYPSMKSQRVVF